MQKISSFFNGFMERYLSSTRQIQRIILFAVIALVLVAGSFAGYYYFDRFYSNQKPVAETSIVEAEQAVQADPANLQTRLVLAETYMLHGRYADALTHANQVFSSDPMIERAWLVIGVASALSGNPANAITPLTNYVNAFKDQEMPGLDKSLQEASYYLGDSYLQLGQPENAILPLEQTVGWSQLDADAMYKLGLAYSGVGRHEEAVNMFAEAVNFVPNFAEAYQAMAVAYDAGGKTDLGDYARGMLAYSQKDYPVALELLIKAGGIYPGYAPIFAGLGLTYEAMGDLQNARTSFETAVSIDSNNFTASRGLERVTALLKK
jgi:tetratricopeptide (TPR) repeat protein